MDAEDAAGPPTRPGGLHMWVDASAGIAGDMLLGALLDAGAPLPDVQDAVDAVVPGVVHITTAGVHRAGLRATKVHVAAAAEEHPHRDWAQIRELLSRAGLAPLVRHRAQRVFELLARAEGRVHGVPPERVRFHEVGAWDSIADVVGVSAALHALGVGSVSAGPAALGSGRILAAHGETSVPVPAVLEMSAGWEVFAGGAGELATPTGMALMRTLAVTCEALPALRVTSVGVGAGSRDVADRANVVRVVLGHPVGDARGGPGGGVEQMTVLQANVDDLDPRAWPAVLTALLSGGAADAWLTPMLMKKGRPAHTVSVLAPVGRADDLREVVFRHTSTLGVREYPVRRHVLQRAWRPVELGSDTVRIKISRGADGRILHATPEFDDVAEVAGRRGVPVRLLLGEAVAAAARAGLAPGCLFRDTGESNDPA